MQDGQELTNSSMLASQINSSSTAQNEGGELSNSYPPQDSIDYNAGETSAEMMGTVNNES